VVAKIKVRQMQAAASLARCAPHMPALTHLHFSFGDHLTSWALNAFMTAVKAVDAWPVLHWISCAYPNTEQFTSRVRERWPWLVVE
jgi:hypothetical protein